MNKKIKQVSFVQIPTIIPASSQFRRVSARSNHTALFRNQKIQSMRVRQPFYPKVVVTINSENPEPISRCKWLSRPHIDLRAKRFRQSLIDYQRKEHERKLKIYLREQWFRDYKEAKKIVARKIKNRDKRFKQRRMFRKPTVRTYTSRNVIVVGDVGVVCKRRHLCTPIYKYHKAQVKTPRPLQTPKKKMPQFLISKMDWSYLDECEQYTQEQNHLQVAIIKRRLPKGIFDVFSHRKLITSLTTPEVTMQMVTEGITNLFGAKVDMSKDVKQKVDEVLTLIKESGPEAHEFLGQIRDMCTDSLRDYKAANLSSISEAEAASRRFNRDAAAQAKSVAADAAKRTNDIVDKITAAMQPINNALTSYLKTDVAGIVSTKILGLILTIYEAYYAIKENRLGSAIRVTVIYLSTVLNLTGDLVLGPARKFAQYLQTCIQHYKETKLVAQGRHDDVPDCFSEKKQEEGFIESLCSVFSGIFQSNNNVTFKDRVFVQRFVNLSTLLRSCSNIAEFASKAIHRILTWLANIFIPSHEIESINNAANEWCNQVTTLIASGIIVDSAKDPRLLGPVNELKKRGDALLRDVNHISRNKDITGVHVLLRTIMQKMSELQKCQEKAVKLSYNVRSRPEPPCVCITGPPGQGKSYITPLLMMHLAHRCGLKNYVTVGDPVGANAFTYSSACTHFDGYRNQPFFLIDDFLPYNNQERAIDFIDVIIRVVNTAPYHPSMAELDEKKTTQVDSAFVIVNSNRKLQYPKNSIGKHTNFPATLLVDAGALVRRLHLRVEMQVKPEWLKPDGTIDADKVMAEGRSDDTTIYTFMQYNDEKDLGPITFFELVDKLYELWKVKTTSYYTSLAATRRAEKSMGEKDIIDEKAIAKEILGDLYDEKDLSYNRRTQVLNDFHDFTFMPYELYNAKPTTSMLARKLGNKIVNAFKRKPLERQKLVAESDVEGSMSSSYVKITDVSTDSSIPLEPTVIVKEFLQSEDLPLTSSMEDVITLIRSDDSIDIVEALTIDAIRDSLAEKERQRLASEGSQFDTIFDRIKDLPRKQSTGSTDSGEDVFNYVPKITCKTSTWGDIFITILPFVGLFIATIAVWKTSAYVTGATIKKRALDSANVVVLEWADKMWEHLFGKSYSSAMYDIAFDTDRHIAHVVNQLYMGCPLCGKNDVTHLSCCPNCFIIHYECLKCLCMVGKQELAKSMKIELEDMAEFEISCQSLKNYHDPTKVKNVRTKVLNRVLKVEGCLDSQATALSKRLLNNIAKVSFRTKDSCLSCQALFVTGSFFITVGHIMRDWKRYKTSGDMSDCYLDVVMDLRGLRTYRAGQVEWVHDVTSDIVMCCIVDKTFSSVPNILGKFIPTKRVNEITPNKILIPYVTFQDKTVENVKIHSHEILSQLGSVVVKRDGWFFSNSTHADENNQPIDANWSFNYLADTSDGYCGTPIILVDVGEQRKILGIHIAGNKHGLGRGGLIDEDYLNQLLAAIKLKVNIPIVNDNALSEVALITQGKDTNRWPPFEEESPLPVMGMLPTQLGVSQSTKSKIRHSAVYGLWPTNKELPNLRPSDNNNPLKEGILKEFQLETKIFVPDTYWSEVKDQIVRNIEELRSPFIYRGVLTLAVAINGEIGTPELKSIEMNTSAGWPYSITARNSRGKGKEPFFEGEENHKTLIAFVQRDYNKALEKCRNLEIPFLPFTTTLKDEKKTKGKAIRTFKAGNMVLNILGKQYFGAFMAHLQYNCVQGESSIGINIYSDQWNDFVVSRMFMRPNIIAGDFKNFDRSLNYELLMNAFDIIDRWYSFRETIDQYEENSKIRRVIWITTIRAYAVATRYVYLAYWGNSSGNWGTGVINNVCQMILFRLLFLTESTLTLDEFPKHVKCGFFGDDHIVFVSDQIPGYNQLSISKRLSKWGFHYTDANKEAVSTPYETINTASYLRATFARFPDGKYYAKRDLQSLRDMVMFVSNYTSLKEATIGNIEDACNQMCVGYTEDEYLDFFKQIQNHLLFKHAINWEIPNYFKTRLLFYGSEVEITKELCNPFPRGLKGILQRPFEHFITEGIGDDPTDMTSQSNELVSAIKQLIDKPQTSTQELAVLKDINSTLKQLTSLLTVKATTALPIPASAPQTSTGLVDLVRAISVSVVAIARTLVSLQTSQTDLVNYTGAIQLKVESLETLVTGISRTLNNVNTVAGALNGTAGTIDSTLKTSLRKLTDIQNANVNTRGSVVTNGSKLDSVVASLASIKNSIPTVSDNSTTITTLGTDLALVKETLYSILTQNTGSKTNLDSINLAVNRTQVNGNIVRLIDQVIWTADTTESVNTHVTSIDGKIPSLVRRDVQPFPTTINAHIFGRVGTAWRPIDLEMDGTKVSLRVKSEGSIRANIFGQSPSGWVPFPLEKISEQSLVPVRSFGVKDDKVMPFSVDQHGELMVSLLGTIPGKGPRPLTLTRDGYLQVFPFVANETGAAPLYSSQGALHVLACGRDGDVVEAMTVVTSKVNTAEGIRQFNMPFVVSLGLDRTTSSLFPFFTSVVEYLNKILLRKTRSIQEAAISTITETVLDYVTSTDQPSTSTVRRRRLPTAPRGLRGTRDTEKHLYPFIAEMETSQPVGDALIQEPVILDQEALATIETTAIQSTSFPSVSKIVPAPPIPVLDMLDYPANPVTYMVFSIDGSEPTGKHILSVRPLELVMQNKVVREKINRYTLMRYSSIKLRFLIHATAFHYGYLAAHWSPPNTKRADNLITASGQPMWTLLPLKSNSEVEMTVPWFWPEDWMKISDFSKSKTATGRASGDVDGTKYDGVSMGLLKPDDDFAGGAPHHLYPTSGAIHVNVYQPLNVMDFGNTPISPINISLMINIEGMQIIGNTKASYLQSVGDPATAYIKRNLSFDPLANVRFAFREYTRLWNVNELRSGWNGTVGNYIFRTEMLAAAEIGSQVLTGKSLTENAKEAITKVTSHVMEAAEGAVPVIGEITGRIISSAGFEKPISLEAPTHIIHKWANIANTCGISTAHYLAMSPSNNIARPESLEPFRFDGSIESITSRKTLIFMTFVKDQSTSTSLLRWHVNPANVPVTPAVAAPSGSDRLSLGSVIKKYNTFLSYPCEFFEYWRGDIVLTIHTNASPMQVGRLKWYWNPVETWVEQSFVNSGTVDVDNDVGDTILSSMALHGYIVLSSEKWTEIKIPYLREVPMLSTDYSEATGRHNNGCFYLEVASSQTSAEASNPPFWVYVYVHGENMQFFSPTITNMSSTPYSDYLNLYDGRRTDDASVDVGSWYQLPPREYKWLYGKMSRIEDQGNYPDPPEHPHITTLSRRKPRDLVTQGSGTPAIATEHLFGESFMNLLDLCKRPSEAFIASVKAGFGFMYSYFAQNKLYMNQPNEHWNYLYYTGAIRDLDALRSANGIGQLPIGFGSYQHHTSRLFCAQRGAVIYRVMKDASLGARVITPHSDTHSFTMSQTKIRSLPIVRIDGGVLPTNYPCWDGTSAFPFNGAVVARTLRQGANPVAYYQLQRRLARGLYYKADNNTNQPVEGVVPFYSGQSFWFTPETIFLGASVTDPDITPRLFAESIGSRMIQCEDAFPGVHVTSNADSSALITVEFADNFNLYLMRLPQPVAFWIPSSTTNPLLYEDMPTYNTTSDKSAGVENTDRGPRVPLQFSITDNARSNKLGS